MTTFNNKFLSGLLFGLAQILAEGGNPEYVASVIKNSGVTQKELDRVEIEDIDLEYLLPALEICELLTPRTKNKSV